MKIYIGHDPNELDALDAALHSLRMVSDIEPEILSTEKLRSRGLWTRVVDTRGGQGYDFNSGAPCSTDFAVSRFVVPILSQNGWALFTDCDVLFLSDPAEILEYADPSKAVLCVHHEHHGSGTKMVDKIQTHYSRKNWSSVMLFNCDHPANKRLTVNDVNVRPGRDLHGYYWLNDCEIGALSPDWNWLVNVTPRPPKPRIAHFTNGGPWLNGWTPSPFDDLWDYYFNRFNNYKESKCLKRI